MNAQVRVVEVVSCPASQRSYTSMARVSRLKYRTVRPCLFLSSHLKVVCRPSFLSFSIFRRYASTKSFPSSPITCSPFSTAFALNVLILCLPNHPCLPLLNTLLRQLQNVIKRCEYFFRSPTHQTRFQNWQWTECVKH